MKRSILVLLVSLLSFSSTLNAVAGVHWSVVKSCPQGFELVRGQAYAPATPSISFSAKVSREALASLNSQLKTEIDPSIRGLSTPRWGFFTGEMVLGHGQEMRKVTLEERGSDLLLQVFDSANRLVADYYFRGCY